MDVAATLLLLFMLLLRFTCGRFPRRIGNPPECGVTFTCVKTCSFAFLKTIYICLYLYIYIYTCVYMHIYTYVFENRCIVILPRTDPRTPCNPRNCTLAFEVVRVSLFGDSCRLWGGVISWKIYSHSLLFSPPTPM